MACKFRYQKEFFPAEYEIPMRNLHETVVRELQLSGVSFDKYKKEAGRYRMPVEEYTEAIRIVGGINKSYGQILTIKDIPEKVKGKGTIITKVLDLNVGPVADQLYYASDAEKRMDTEQDNNQFDIDGDIMPTQNNRMYKGIDINNQAATDRKASIMEDRFNALGISSKIIYDTTLEASGALLGKGTTEYAELIEKGVIQAGQAAIVVNPNKLYSDTIFHEYGHLLVDILSGTNNARIDTIYKELTSTPLYSKVKEAYPELSGEALKREVVTQALGQKADELFIAQEQQSTWKKFVLWVKNTLGKVFNIDKETSNELTILANELLGKNEVFATDEMSEQSQFQKETEESDPDFEARQIMEKDLSTINGVRAAIYSNLSLQVRNLRSNPNENVQTYVEDITKLLEDLDNTEDEKIILSYVENITGQIDNIYKIVNNSNTTSKQYLDMIGIFNDKLKAFRLVKEIQAALNSDTKLPDSAFKSNESKEAVNTVINEAVNKLQATKSKLDGKSLTQVSNFLADYSNYAFVEAQDKYYKEFNRLEKNIDIDKTTPEYKQERQEYVDNKVDDNIDTIKAKNLTLIRNKLEKTSVDLSWFAAHIHDTKDVNDLIIQLTQKIIDDADLQRNVAILTLKIDASNIYQEFKKNHPGTDPATIFKGFYEEGSDGTLYLTTRYSAEFHIARSKAYDIRNKVADKYGEGTLQTKEADKVLQNFFKKETKNGIPNAKWLNKDFSKIENEAMYKWLVDTSHANDHKLNGMQSNIINTTEYTLIKIPEIRKAGFEQLSSGSLLQNAWESIQSIYKVQSDDTEFGGAANMSDTKKRTKTLYAEVKKRQAAGEDIQELTDEIQAMQVLTNEVGDLKSTIPIFFRGKHDLKNQSYDLMSNLILDSFMAENHKQKTKFRYAVDLTLDLVNSREVQQTAGGLNKTLVYLTGGNKAMYETVNTIVGKDSKGGKLLASIIENRMYGIKTVNEDFAQFASSLMAWTATAMLGFNFLAASSNVLQGKVTNFIESIGRQWFDKNDLAKAEVSFWAEFRDWMDDMGRPVQTAKINQLMDLFSVQGEFKSFTNKLTEDTRFKALLKKSTIFSYNSMGEFYIQGTMMYAILNRIKAKNAKGQFINKEGKVVTEPKAMNMNDAFSVNAETNQLKLNKYVKKTSFGRQTISLTDLGKDKGILELGGLINKIAADLHGQYNDEYQSHAQRYVLGKMVAMLRKWILRGFTRRWRGARGISDSVKGVENVDNKFYSEDAQSFNEGSYTSFIKFLLRIKNDLKSLGLQGAFTTARADLTEHEAANLRRTMADLTMMGLTLITSMMVYANLDGLDDDDEEALLYLAFYSRRLFNEMSFFINPVATFQILRSPAATVSYVEDIIKLFGQIAEDSYGIVSGEGLEYYERGSFKGYPKLKKRTFDLIPILSKLDTDIYQSASYQYVTAQ